MSRSSPSWRRAAYEAALGGPAATCFVLTNTRSLDEPAAIQLTMHAARGLWRWQDGVASGSS